jgi:hypothetical protein
MFKPLIFVHAKNAIAIFSKDFFMSERPVAGVFGSTVLYMRPLPTPLSCVLPYLGQFWEKKSKVIVFWKAENLAHRSSLVVEPW